MPSHPDRVRRNYADIPIVTSEAMPLGTIHFVTRATQEQVDRGEAVEVSPGYFVYGKGCATIKNVGLECVDGYDSRDDQRRCCPVGELGVEGVDGID